MDDCRISPLDGEIIQLISQKQNSFEKTMAAMLLKKIQKKEFLHNMLRILLRSQEAADHWGDNSIIKDRIFTQLSWPFHN